MKIFIPLLIMTLLVLGCSRGRSDQTADKQRSLDKATASIRDAFARGDVAAIVALHSPEVVKYFGGSNVVTGRAGLARQLTGMFKSSKVEFTENKVENTAFTGEMAVQTVIFGLKIIPRAGGKATFFRGRSMVVYVRDQHSPTGWYSLREMTQAAPDQ
jgi:ketosteroid isomerase-like protein